MSKKLDHIDEAMAEWISKQRLFFVGTAPLSGEGHVNVSPKGGGAFRVLGPLEVAYQDYTGSGAETVAHLRENGRLVVMFCAFKGPPRIVRLHGRGVAVIPGMERYQELEALFPPHPGTRAFIVMKVQRVSSSCGFSIPLFEFKKDRDVLDVWSRKQGPEGVAQYRARKNQKSLDGLPAFDTPQGGKVESKPKSRRAASRS